ncbi:dephospho-CoA kinase [Lachnospiraceae bacterium 46-15]
MKVLGITGGVGAGKSTVLAYLSERYQAKVIQADKTAHILEQPGQECYHRIVEEFGKEILGADGAIDRRLLGSIVFSDKKSLERLNGIVHPAVREYIIQEIRQEQLTGMTPFVVLEAALLIEEHYDEICDEIWYVRAGEETRQKRLMASRGYTAEKVREIMQNQLSDALFLKHCQFVVDNSSDFIENTYGQIDRGLVEHGFL